MNLTEDDRRWIADQISASEARLREHTETVETRLLTEFFKWARSADARYRQYYGHVSGVEQRMGNIEERITIIEDRVSELERGDQAPQH